MTILELLANKDEALLVKWNPLLVLDLLFDILNGVSWVNLQSDGLAGKSLTKICILQKKR